MKKSYVMCAALVSLLGLAACNDAGNQAEQQAKNDAKKINIENMAPKIAEGLANKCLAGGQGLACPTENAEDYIISYPSFMATIADYNENCTTAHDAKSCTSDYTKYLSQALAQKLAKPVSEGATKILKDNEKAEQKAKEAMEKAQIEVNDAQEKAAEATQQMNGTIEDKTKQAENEARSEIESSSDKVRDAIDSAEDKSQSATDQAVAKAKEAADQAKAKAQQAADAAQAKAQELSEKAKADWEAAKNKVQSSISNNNDDAPAANTNSGAQKSDQ